MLHDNMDVDLADAMEPDRLSEDTVAEDRLFYGFPGPKVVTVSLRPGEVLLKSTFVEERDEGNPMEGEPACDYVAGRAITIVEANLSEAQAIGGCFAAEQGVLFPDGADGEIARLILQRYEGSFTKFCDEHTKNTERGER